MAFRIMIFDWNADGLKLCETSLQNKADDRRSGLQFFRRAKCTAPDFFSAITQLIRDNQVSLVLFSTQEAIKESYFHSEFLPAIMKPLGYSLLKSDEMEGMRGPNTDASAIRLSIYAQNDVVKELRSQEANLVNILKDDDAQREAICTRGARTSGVIGSYVQHREYGIFLFMAAYLPPGDDLTLGRYTFDQYRESILNVNRDCLSSILRGFTSNISPDRIILFGDLNYVNNIPDKYPDDVARELSADLSLEFLHDLYIKYDELYKARQETFLQGFKEGVNDQGPMFMPTWKLRLDRSHLCSPLDSRLALPHNQCFAAAARGEMPSWRDRIIYKEIPGGKYSLVCEYYNRFDVNNINKSTHAGVIGVFHLST